MRALFSDDFHVNRRNFGPIFAHCERSRTEINVLVEGRELWNRYGDYRKNKRVQAKRADLLKLGREALYSLSVDCCRMKIPVRELVVSEVLSYIIPKRGSGGQVAIESDNDKVFLDLYDSHQSELIDSVAAAQVWAEIYSREIARDYDFAVVFSGGQIYQKLMIEVMKRTKARTFLIETFQTGTDFYFEERYSAIPNGCDIRHDNVYRAINFPSERSARDEEVKQALNKLLNAKNKNVTQPEGSYTLPFPASNRTILLCCQVLNDFSIIETAMKNRSSIDVYKKIIDAVLLRTDLNLMIKPHPYEERKIGVNAPMTAQALQGHIETAHADHAHRVALATNVNMGSLLKQVDGFITLNSQASFEACLFGGLRPITLGKPFYGRRGFTTDYDDVEAMVRDLNGGTVELKLDLEAYDRFLEFCAKLLGRQLVSDDVHGEAAIKARIMDGLDEIGMDDSGPFGIWTRRMSNLRSDPHRTFGKARLKMADIARRRLKGLW